MRRQQSPRQGNYELLENKITRTFTFTELYLCMMQVGNMGNETF